MNITKYIGEFGEHAVGDTVRVEGYAGTWTVKNFAHDYRSSSQGEMHTALVHESGRALFYPSHFVRKA